MVTRFPLAFALAIAAGALAADLRETTFDLTIVSGNVAPQQRLIAVEKGDAVRLRVTSDSPGELHLHGYGLEARLEPGKPEELSFRAYATGRYPFEWHGTGESGKSRSRRAAPLATIEVRPR